MCITKYLNKPIHTINAQDNINHMIENSEETSSQQKYVSGLYIALKCCPKFIRALCSHTFLLLFV